MWELFIWIGRIGSLTKEATIEKKHTWENKINYGAMATKQVAANIMNLCPAGLCL